MDNHLNGNKKFFSNTGVTGRYSNQLNYHSEPLVTTVVLLWPFEIFPKFLFQNSQNFTKFLPAARHCIPKNSGVWRGRHE